MFYVSFRNVVENDKDSTFPLPTLRTSVLVSLNSFAYRFTYNPISFISTTIWPHFYSVAVWFPFAPLTIINLTIWKLAFAFQKFAFFPLTFENCSVGQNLFTVASSFTINPSPVKNGSIR